MKTKLGFITAWNGLNTMLASNPADKIRPTVIHGHSNSGKTELLLTLLRHQMGLRQSKSLHDDGVDPSVVLCFSVDQACGAMMDTLVNAAQVNGMIHTPDLSKDRIVELDWEVLGKHFLSLGNTLNLYNVRHAQHLDTIEKAIQKVIEQGIIISGIYIDGLMANKVAKDLPALMRSLHAMELSTVPVLVTSGELLSGDVLKKDPNYNHIYTGVKRAEKSRDFMDTLIVSVGIPLYSGVVNDKVIHLPFDGCLLDGNVAHG